MFNIMTVAVNNVPTSTPGKIGFPGKLPSKRRIYWNKRYLQVAGSNTSIVTLRVVGGDEKGSLKSETVKYGRESQGTGTRERLRCQGPAEYTTNRPVLSSEKGVPQKNKTVTIKQ
jgi:hypothetical protein